MEIILISKCLGQSIAGSAMHFKGYFLGEKIKKVIVDAKLDKGIQYIVYGSVREIVEGVMYVKGSEIKEI